jgi:2-C-methyl-D-erythritol 4-phosphate cytidylyltransferase
MFLGQTPQSFNMSKLKKLYSELTEEEKNILTDTCKIFYLRNKPIKIVNGDVSNIKITTVSDYKIAQAMVGGRLFD